MKIWKKIFLYSIILTMILINLVGINMIDRVHKKNLERTIYDTLDIQRNILNSIYLNYDTSDYKYIPNYDVSPWLNIILKNYIYSAKDNIKNIQVFDDKQLIASLNKDSNVNIDDLLFSNKTVFSIKEVNMERILIVSSVIKINDENLKLVLTRSMEFLYQDKSENFKIFITLDIVMNLFLIMGMYLISRQITKPIVSLANTSKEIAKGDYSKRAQGELKKDEIGILSKNFNLMMEELETKIDELKESNDEKERFINNLTHEMKTPITSIIGYSDILLKGNINDDIRIKSLDYINSQARRLENLSSSLIKLTLIKNDQLEKEIISISECVNSANILLNYKILEKKISLKMNLLEIKIKADKSLMMILFKNLLENAINACGIKGNIHVIGVLIDNHHYKIQIIDDGKGIKEEDIKKIMEPFYVVDKSRTRKENGLGLGLAICKEICSIHKIKFNIISAEGQGTQVVLDIKIGEDDE